jgi:hypothetical protein
MDRVLAWHYGFAAEELDPTISRDIRCPEGHGDIIWQKW